MFGHVHVLESCLYVRVRVRIRVRVRVRELLFRGRSKPNLKVWHHCGRGYKIGVRRGSTFRDIPSTAAVGRRPANDSGPDSRRSARSCKRHRVDSPRWFSVGAACHFTQHHACIATGLLPRVWQTTGLVVVVVCVCACVHAFFWFFCVRVCRG